MKLSAQFDLQKVDHEKDNTVRLLLGITAPSIDWVAQRPRVCILPVVDVSGSMNEDSKLVYAKQACAKLVEQLRVGDYAGLVTFNGAVQTPVPPAPVTAELKARLLKAIDGLYANGGTNFSESISQALGKLEGLDLAPSILQRLIFFTDGQPTAGITDPEVIKGLVTDRVGSRSMSFFGYGAGPMCDQDLLTELSQRGKGNYAYVKNPDDALAAFGRELGGLLSTYGTDLRLVIEPRNGHTVDKVVTLLGAADGGVTADATELSLELGDILAEETRYVVLSCGVRKQDKALPRDFTIFSVKATCLRVTQDGSKESVEVTTPARIRFVSPEDAQQQPTQLVDEIASLHELARVQKEAEDEAKKGNYVVAHAKLANMSAELRTKGRVATAQVASNLAGWVASPDAYSASGGYRRSVGGGILRSANVSSFDSSARADMDYLEESVGMTFSNSSQAAYTAAFTGNTTNNLVVTPENVVNSTNFIVKPKEPQPDPDAAAKATP